MELIDLSNAEDVRARRPIIIAHRGGVVDVGSPEGSLKAIRLAAEWGYDMVELDAQETADGHPVSYHDPDLYRSVGLAKKVRDLTLAEAVATHYLASEERIASLDEALGLCRSLNLGVMIELKDYDGTASADFYRRIGELIVTHGLQRATMVFPPREPALEHLPPEVWLKLVGEECRLAMAGEGPQLERKFWFATAQQLPTEAVAPLQERGALVIPAINNFRYPPHADHELARQDVARLTAAGVDGFQSDSMYGKLYSPKITGD